jgi:hypothetical protein
MLAESDAASPAHFPRRRPTQEVSLRAPHLAPSQKVGVLEYPLLFIKNFLKIFGKGAPVPYSKQMVDLTGQRFGYLVALRRDGLLRTPYSRIALWRCRCDCGREITTWGKKLRRGKKKSCGVRGHRFKIERPKTLAAIYPTEHGSWRGMWERVRGRTAKRKRNYKDRGITVCDRWKSFAAFLEDMGKKPTPKHTLDRFPNNDGNYEPTNCRWATPKEQSRNMRTTIFVEYEGKRMPLMEVVETLGLKASVIRGRIVNGWSLEEAIAFPTYGRNRRSYRSVAVKFAGKKIFLHDLVKKLGLKYEVVYGRIKNGWDIKEAISAPVRKKAKNGLK